MDQPLNNNLCKAHSGIIERIKDCERNVRALWNKWDRMQITVLAIFITLSLNLIGVIFLLIKLPK